MARLRVSVLTLADPLHHLVPHDPVDAGDAGHAVLGADTVGDQPLSDLPGEHGGVLSFVLRDGVHYGGCGHLGFAAAYNSRSEGASLVISGEYLGDTAMRYSELSADITRPHSLVSKFHDPLSHHVRKRSTVDKKASKLVNTPVACNSKTVTTVVSEVRRTVISESQLTLTCVVLHHVLVVSVGGLGEVHAHAGHAPHADRGVTPGVKQGERGPRVHGGDSQYEAREGRLASV